MFSRTSHKGHRAYALIDISDTSVGGALCVQKEGTTVIHWSKRVFFATNKPCGIPEQSKRMYGALMELTTSFAQEAVKIFPRTSHAVRDLEIVCVLTPPWCYTDMAQITHLETKRKAMSHGVLDGIRAQVYEAILASPRYAQWESVVGVGTIVEQVDQVILYDGYVTLPTRTYEARSISLQTLFTLAPESVITKTRELLMDMLPQHTIHMRSSVTMFAGVPGIYRPDRSARQCFIEVGGLYSTLTLLEKGKVAGVSSIPYGTLELFQALTPQALSYAESQQRAFMLAKQREPLTEEESMKTLERWANALREVIPHLTSGITPPAHASMYIDEPLYEWYANVLKTPWVQHGVREQRSFTVFPAIEASSQSSKEVVDKRLHTLCTAVDEESRKL